MVTFELDLIKINTDSYEFTSNMRKYSIDKTGDLHRKSFPAEFLDFNFSVTENKKFRAIYKQIAGRSHYFGGIELPSEVASNSSEMINKLRILNESIIQSIDLAFSARSWQRSHDELIRTQIHPEESLRLVISSNDRSIQDLPIENTPFIRDRLGRERSLSVIFVPL